MAIEYKIRISEKQRKLIMRALTTAVANNRRLTSGGVLNDDEWMGLIAVFANPQAADDLPGQSYISGEGWGRAKTKLGVELGRSIACGSLICPRLLLLPQRATMQTPQGFDAKHHRWVVSQSTTGSGQGVDAIRSLVSHNENRARITLQCCQASFSQLGKKPGADRTGAEILVTPSHPVNQPPPACRSVTPGSKSSTATTSASGGIRTPGARASWTRRCAFGVRPRALPLSRFSLLQRGGNAAAGSSLRSSWQSAACR